MDARYHAGARGESALESAGAPIESRSRVGVRRRLSTEYPRPRSSESVCFQLTARR